MKQIESPKRLKQRKKRGKIDIIITQENIETCIHISCKELKEEGICYWLEKRESEKYPKRVDYICKGKNKQFISSVWYERPKWCPLLKLKKKKK